MYVRKDRPSDSDPFGLLAAEKKLKAMLPKERQKLDAIIDGAGGDVVDKGAKLLRVRQSHSARGTHC